MTHRLDGCREKIKRAGEHLRRLKAETNAFADPRTYSFTADIEPEADGWDRVILTARANQPEVDPPLVIGAVVGDVAHNLRSALDHLVCQLASGSCNGTQFPICDSVKAWNGEIDKGRLRGVKPRHRAMIERVQPYHGRITGRALRALRELSNADKHRMLNPTRSASPLRGPVFTPADAVLELDIAPLGWVVVKDGAEVMRFRVRLRPRTHVNVNLNQTFAIMFGERWPVTLQDVVMLRTHIRRLIGRFAGEF